MENEKALKCMAMHLQQYTRIYMYQDENVPNACEICEMASECYKNGVSDYWMEAAYELVKLTGIDILGGVAVEKEEEKSNLQSYALRMKLLDLHLKAAEALAEGKKEDCQSLYHLTKSAQILLNDI